MNKSALLNLTFQEIKRIGPDKLALALGSGTLVAENGFLKHDELFNELIKYSCNVELLDRKKGLISVSFIQFLSLQVSLEKEQPDLSNLPKIRAYLKDKFTYSKLFPNWIERGMLVVYLCYAGLTNWQQLVLTVEANTDIQLLEGAMPYCYLTIDDLFTFIRQANQHSHANGRLLNLGTQLVNKLTIDKDFAAQLEERLPELIADDVLRQLLPGMLKGIIGQDVQHFQKLLTKLTATNEQQMPNVCFAFAVACPDEPSCRSILKEFLQTGNLRRPAYIFCLATSRLSDEETLKEIVTRAHESDDPEEITQLAQYLSIYIDRAIDPWFRESAAALLVKKGDHLVATLGDFLFFLAEKDAVLCYELLTLRFRTMGKEAFLMEQWGELVDANHALFHTYLTKWFLSGEQPVYNAVFELCGVQELEVTDFRLDDAMVAALSQGDKLFIALKNSWFCL